jgi:hypothetical protein
MRSEAKTRRPQMFPQTQKRHRRTTAVEEPASATLRFSTALCLVFCYDMLELYLSRFVYTKHERILSGLCGRSIMRHAFVLFHSIWKLTRWPQARVAAGWRAGWWVFVAMLGHAGFLRAVHSKRCVSCEVCVCVCVCVCTQKMRDRWHQGRLGLEDREA